MLWSRLLGASSLTFVALGLLTQGDLAGARPLYERALAIYEKALGPEHADTASCLTYLAMVLRNQGDLTGAQPLLERALAIYGRRSAPSIPRRQRAATTSLAGLGP
jgi:tetratricopeptide (TPR) repeat protein